MFSLLLDKKKLAGFNDFALVSTFWCFTTDIGSINDVTQYYMFLTFLVTLFSKIMHCHHKIIDSSPLKPWCPSCTIPKTSSQAQLCLANPWVDLLPVWTAWQFEFLRWCRESSSCGWPWRHGPRTSCGRQCTRGSSTSSECWSCGASLPRYWQTFCHNSHIWFLLFSRGQLWCVSEDPAWRRISWDRCDIQIVFRSAKKSYPIHSRIT